jgi:hypothetical protein
MGWYVECPVCGEREKSGAPDCQCVWEQITQMTKERQNSIIVESCTMCLDTGIFGYRHILIEKTNKDGQNYYYKFNLNNIDHEQGKYSSFVKLLTEEQYNKILNDNYVYDMKEKVINEDRIDKKIILSEHIKARFQDECEKFIEKYDDNKTRIITFAYGSKYQKFMMTF